MKVVGPDTFFNCYVRTRSLIEQFPDGAPRYSHNPNVRRISIEDFPYLIYYLNLDEKIFILAVIHDSRRPGFWLERLKFL
nr:type II toxin-antitoxin system RelE/ParE family toxin [Leptospira interrogans]